MTNAIFTQSVFAGDGTQGTFLSNLSTSMISTGFDLVNTVNTINAEVRVWKFSVDATAVGTLILECAFSAATTLRFRGFSSYDAATDTGSNPSVGQPTTTISLSASFNLISINHPEQRGVIIYQNGINIGFVGYFRPLIVATGWGTVSPFGFIPRALASWSTGALQPISSLRPSGLTTNQFMGDICNSSPSPLNQQKRTVKTAPWLVDGTSGNGGSFDVCPFSVDVGLGASNGMSMVDIIPDNNIEYTLTDSPSNVYSRLFVRNK